MSYHRFCATTLWFSPSWLYVYSHYISGNTTFHHGAFSVLYFWGGRFIALPLPSSTCFSILARGVVTTELQSELERERGEGGGDLCPGAPTEQGISKFPPTYLPVIALIVPTRNFPPRKLNFPLSAPRRSRSSSSRQGGGGGRRHRYTAAELPESKVDKGRMELPGR